MTFLQPTTWAEAFTALDDDPELLPIAGGTDLMVDFNFRRRRPGPMLDVTRIDDIDQWWREGDRLRIGAGVPYTRIIEEIGDASRGLTMASRTVASRQIRNRGTVGGNLATASPAGDSAPTLLASGAEVEIRSSAGTRYASIGDFFTGVKRNALQPGELIAAIWVDADTGPQQFTKIGTRNAMVISVASLAITLHPSAARVGTGMGSVGPTPLQATAATEFLEGELRAGDYWDSRRPLPDSLCEEFGQKVAAAGRPIDDVRGKAAYRIHALQVMARRSLGWAWADYQKGAA